ncbi:hypothetical protein ACJJTC_015632 [Scirpophaga incertulas]
MNPQSNIRLAIAPLPVRGITQRNSMPHNLILELSRQRRRLPRCNVRYPKIQQHQQLRAALSHLLSSHDAACASRVDITSRRELSPARHREHRAHISARNRQTDGDSNTFTVYFDKQIAHSANDSKS